MLKKIASGMTAAAMALTMWLAPVQAAVVVTNHTMIDEDFQNYEIGAELTDPTVTAHSPWTAQSMKWHPVVTQDLDGAAQENQALFLKTAAADSPDGGGANIPISANLENPAVESAEVSFRVYIPQGVDSGNGVPYNSESFSTNQGGFSLYSSDGQQIFYMVFDVYGGQLLTFYPNEGNGDRFTNTLTKNQWHSIRIALDFQTEQYTFYLDGEEGVTQKLYHPGADLKRADFYLHRNAARTLVGIDDFKVTGSETIDESQITLTYTVGQADYQRHTLPVTGRVAPCFGQTVSATLTRDSDSQVVATAETKATEGMAGDNFALNLNLPDDLKGWCLLQMDTDHITTPPAATRIYLASEQETQAALEAFNSLPTAFGSAELAAAEETLRDYLEVALSGAEAAVFQAHPQEVARYFIARKRVGDIYAAIGEIAQAYEAGAALTELYLCPEAGLWTMLEDCDFLTGELAQPDCAAAADAVPVLFVKLRTQAENGIFASQEEVRTVLRTAVGLITLNRAETQEIKGILNRYAQVFGIVTDSGDAARVNQTKLYEALAHRDYDDVDQVCRDFDAKVQELLAAGELEEIHVTLPAVMIDDDFEDYAPGADATANGRWGKEEMTWRPVVDQDPTDPENQALFMVRSASDNPEGTANRLLYPTVQGMEGPIDISYRIYFPNQLDAGDGTNYNSESNDLNQGGLFLYSTEGAQLFYSVYYAYSGEIITFYAGEDGSGQRFTNKISMNQWHEIRISLDLDAGSYTYYLDGAPTGTYRIYHPGKVLQRAGLFLHRNATRTMIGIDDFKIEGTENLSFAQAQVALSYQLQPMDYQNRTLTVTGRVSPYFNQKVYGTLASRDGGQETLRREVQVTRDGAEGTFVLALPLAETMSGWYTLTMDTDYLDTPAADRSTAIYLPSAGELAGLVADFNSLPVQEAEARAVLERYRSLLLQGAADQLLADYGQLLTRSFIHWREAGKTYAKAEEIAAACQEAQTLAELTVCPEDGLEPLLNQTDFLAPLLQSQDGQKVETGLPALFASLREEFAPEQFYSQQEAQDCLRAAVGLALLNQSLRGEIQEVVAAYNDILKLDTGSSQALALDQDELYAMLYRKDFRTLAKLRTAFADAVKTLTEAAEKESGDKGGGNSGGGGLGGKPYVSADSAAPQPQITPLDIPPVQNGLNDIAGHWAEAYILALADKGIVHGYPDGSFQPENTVTRAEFTAMLAAAWGLTDAQGDAFADVPAEAWYSGCVYGAYQADLVQGDGNLFRPEDSISRQELATLLYRAAAARALNLAPQTAAAAFRDGNAIADYAREAVETLSAARLISGYEDNSFRPLAFATRGEAAKLLAQMMELK